MRINPHHEKKTKCLLLIVSGIILTLLGGQILPGFAQEQTTQGHSVFLPLIQNGKTTPKLTIWTDQARLAVMQELATAYEATHDVDVIVQGHDNLRDDFLSAAPAGEGPDITVFAHDQVAQLQGAGLLSPISLNGLEEDFTQTALEAMTINGSLYGLPYSVENLGMFYNTDLVPSPPTTWDELHTMGLALQDTAGVTWGFALSGTSYDAYPLMTANGGYVFGKNPDGSWNTGDLGIGSAGMISFGQLAKDWADEGFLNPSINWTDAHDLFKAGEVPWIMAGPWALGQIRYSGVPYAISNFPSGYPFLGVQGFVINSFSTEQTLAASFLTEFMADIYPMTRLYEEGNRPPAYIPGLNTITDPDMIAFGQVAAFAEPMPNVPEMGCVWGPWGNALTFIIAGTKTPTQAYTDAYDQIRNCIDNPFPGMVNVPGSYQSEVGCSADWDPACAITALTEGGDGLYRGTFTIPAGDYECKVALNGSWAENYGAGGVRDGDNIPFSVATEGEVAFTYHPDTHILDISQINMVSVPGSYQTEVGCSADWDPACTLTVLTEGGDGLYRGTFTIPAGDYECKVAINGSWDENYGAGGVRDGDNIPFSLSADGEVSFTFHPDTHILDILLP